MVTLFDGHKTVESPMISVLVLRNLIRVAREEGLEAITIDDLEHEVDKVERELG